MDRILWNRFGNIFKHIFISIEIDNTENIELKQVWQKSNINKTVYLNFCQNTEFLNNGQNAAVVMEICSKKNGIYQINNNFPYICQKSETF